LIGLPDDPFDDGRTPTDGWTSLEVGGLIPLGLPGPLILAALLHQTPLHSY